MLVDLRESDARVEAEEADPKASRTRWCSGCKREGCLDNLPLAVVLERYDSLHKLIKPEPQMVHHRHTPSKVRIIAITAAQNDGTTATLHVIEVSMELHT